MNPFYEPVVFNNPMCVADATILWIGIDNIYDAWVGGGGWHEIYAGLTHCTSKGRRI